MNFDSVVDYDLVKIKEKIYQVSEYLIDFYVTPFLDLAKQYHINNLVNKLGIYIHYYCTQERKVAIIYNDPNIDVTKHNPISYLQIESYNELHHNEIMGAVLNIGLKREVIGDIYCKDGLYLIAINKSHSTYIKDNLVYVSRNKVRVLDTNLIIPETNRIKETVIVSSLRLDNVVSSVFNLSREKAKDAIINKYVFLNFENELEIDKKVLNNSYLSLRGKGKVFIKESVGKTRKDKYILEIERF